MKAPLTAVLLALLFPAWSGEVNLFAGTEQQLPFRISGAWKITVPPGRLLASGTAVAESKLVITLPELESGRWISAEFAGPAGKKKLVIHAPDLLLGITGVSNLDKKSRESMKKRGISLFADDSANVTAAFLNMDGTAQAKRWIIFPRWDELPIRLPADYREIALIRHGEGGRFAIETAGNGKDKHIETAGDAEAVRVRLPGGMERIYLHPGWSWDNIENLLLLRQLLNERVKQ